MATALLLRTGLRGVPFFDEAAGRTFVIERAVVFDVDFAEVRAFGLAETVLGFAATPVFLTAAGLAAGAGGVTLAGAALLLAAGFGFLALAAGEAPFFVGDFLIGLSPCSDPSNRNGAVIVAMVPDCLVHNLDRSTLRR